MAGAPTTYKEEYDQMIVDYFTVEPVISSYKRTYFADGTIKSEEPIMMPAPFPTFQGFADSIHTHIDTLNSWMHNIPSFSEAYARAKALQEKIWLVNGMSGQYNSQFAQFFGKNCLGYKDKQEIEANVTVKKLEDVL